MLNITPSKLVPSEVSIKAAKDWLSTASTWKDTHQFRAHGFHSDGGEVNSGCHYQAMCSGSLNVAGPYFQGDVLAVCYLGEFNGGYHSQRTFKFKDNDHDSDGHLWLSYLLGPDSIYTQLHPFLTTLDVEETYQQRGFIFKGLDMMPIALFKCFVIAMRMVAEYPNRFLIWKKLVERGCNPRAAHCVAVPYQWHGSDRYKDGNEQRYSGFESVIGTTDYFAYVSTGSHSSFDNPMNVYIGAIQQTYFGSSHTCRDGVYIKGAYTPDGFSNGFSPKYSVAYRFVPKRYFDNFMETNQSAGRILTGGSYATLEDLANQANLITLIATGALEEKEGNALLDKLWDDVRARKVSGRKQEPVARPKISLDAA